MWRVADDDGGCELGGFNLNLEHQRPRRWNTLRPEIEIDTCQLPAPSGGVHNSKELPTDILIEPTFVSAIVPLTSIRPIDRDPIDWRVLLFLWAVCSMSVIQPSKTIGSRLIMCPRRPKGFGDKAVPGWALSGQRLLQRCRQCHIFRDVCAPVWALSAAAAAAVPLPPIDT